MYELNGPASIFFSLSGNFAFNAAFRLRASSVRTRSSLSASHNNDEPKAYVNVLAYLHTRINDIYYIFYFAKWKRQCAVGGGCWHIQVCPRWINRERDEAKKKIVVHEHDKQAAVADVSENNMQIYSMMCKYNLMRNKMCSESWAMRCSYGSEPNCTYEWGGFIWRWNMFYYFKIVYANKWTNSPKYGLSQLEARPYFGLVLHVCGRVLPMHMPYRPNLVCVLAVWECAPE